MQEYGFFKEKKIFDESEIVNKKIQDLMTVSTYAQFLYNESENENSRFSWLSVELIIDIATYMGKHGLLSDYQARTAAEDFLEFC